MRFLSLVILTLFCKPSQAQNDFDLGCAGLMPSCTLPIFKCADQAPICGGNVEQIVKDCTSNLFICHPRQVGDSVDIKVIFDLDGPDATPKTSSWQGWTFFEDVCTTTQHDLPDCNGMSYQCDDQPAVCGAINEDKADKLRNCYRLNLCAPLDARETDKADMLIHLVESTQEGQSKEETSLWNSLFSSGALPSKTTTTHWILLMVSSLAAAAAL